MLLISNITWFHWWEEVEVGARRGGAKRALSWAGRPLEGVSLRVLG